jgi:hypothetical protein
MARIRTITPLSDQVPASIAANTGIALYLPDGVRYQGVYYFVNDQYLTTPTLTSTTVVLSPTKPASLNTETYDSLKGGNRRNLYVSPKRFIPTITPDDINTGYIQRYFVTKRNEPNVFEELSKQQYDKYSIVNQLAINANQWKRFELRWAIAGEVETVKQRNRKTIVVYEREDNLPGLSKFLFKLDEFYLGKR